MDENLPLVILEKLLLAITLSGFLWGTVGGALKNFVNTFLDKPMVKPHHHTVGSGR
jgi:hypothetical protein